MRNSSSDNYLVAMKTDHVLSNIFNATSRQSVRSHTKYSLNRRQFLFFPNEPHFLRGLPRTEV